VPPGFVAYSGNRHLGIKKTRLQEELDSDQKNQGREKKRKNKERDEKSRLFRRESVKRPMKALVGFESLRRGKKT